MGADQSGTGAASRTCSSTGAGCSGSPKRSCALRTRPTRRGARRPGRRYAALANSQWRHASGAIRAGGPRSTAALVAAVVGGGDYLDWAWGGPAGVLDEEVAASP